jgi:hypothetical protein
LISFQEDVTAAQMIGTISSPSSLSRAPCSLGRNGDDARRCMHGACRNIFLDGGAIGDRMDQHGAQHRRQSHQPAASGMEVTVSFGLSRRFKSWPRASQRFHVRLGQGVRFANYNKVD